MRLSLLDAEFVGEATIHPDGSRTHRRQDQIDGAQGIMFQCPVCVVGKEEGFEDGRHHFKGAHYILCWFSNPRNAPPVPAELTPLPRWELVSGTSIEDLTVSPSILIKAPCAWHGFIKNGDAA